MGNRFARAGQCQVASETLSIAVIGGRAAVIHPLISSLEIRGCAVVRATMLQYLSLPDSYPSIVLLVQQASDRELLKAVVDLRSSNAYRGIIVLGCSVDIGLQAQFLEIGADDYFSCPFDVRDAMARINALVRTMGLQELSRY